MIAATAGTYILQTEGDDGVRLWVNGMQMVNDWTDRAPTLNNTPGIVLAAGQQVPIVPVGQLTGP
jgi:hypothetical protein